ncbi:MAG: hypothetical protein KF878_35615 [Planctomycetes bacterium]|nr:hypothetical protein [Planctomycetota bacterium]MCW8141774.1 hypothetical protein [Planctomycetota bacterium]
MGDESKQAWPGDWELVETGGTSMQQFRQRVPGGWLVLCAMGDTSSMTFLPDPQGEWAPPLKQSRKKGFV